MLYQARMISVDLVVLTHLAEQVEVDIPVRHTGNFVPIKGTTHGLNENRHGTTASIAQRTNS